MFAENKLQGSRETSFDIYSRCSLEVRQDVENFFHLWHNTINVMDEFLSNARKTEQT